MIENAQRAVEGKLPAEHRRNRELWDELVDNIPKPAAETNNPPDQNNASNRSGYNARAGRGSIISGMNQYGHEFTPSFDFNTGINWNIK